MQTIIINEIIQFVFSLLVVIFLVFYLCPGLAISDKQARKEILREERTFLIKVMFSAFGVVYFIRLVGGLMFLYKG